MRKKQRSLDAFEKEISKWAHVDYKKMFGCPCYLANGKMFAGLVTKGIIITKLNEPERNELKKLKEIKPFIMGQKKSKAGFILIWNPKK